MTGRLHFLHLLDDLVEVVACRVLQWREVNVSLEFLQPKGLTDGKHVPVILVSGDQCSEGAAYTHERLDVLANGGLEGVALDVDDLRPVIGDHTSDKAAWVLRHHPEVHLPVLVSDCRWDLVGIVEDVIARRFIRLAFQIVTLVEAVERRFDDPRISAGFDLFLQRIALRPAGDVDERGNPVEGREYLILDRPRLDLSRPTHDERSMPPSQVVSLPPAKGVAPPSG